MMKKINNLFKISVLSAGLFSFNHIAAQVPELQWASSFGSIGLDEGRGITVDKFGNTYSVGKFQSAMTVGSFQLQTSSSASDIFLTKQDNNGNILWAKQIGNQPSPNLVYLVGNAVKTDDSGNIFLTGDFFGQISFEVGNSSATLIASGSTSNVFMAKYDSSGSFVWAKGIGGTAVIANEMAIDKQSNLYLTGAFKDSADFDPSPLNTYIRQSNGNNDIYVAKYNLDGDLIWAKTFGGNNNDFGRGIAVGNNGNVYSTGVFRTTANFDPNGISTQNITVTGNATTSNSDAYISVLDSLGNFVWADKIGSTTADQGATIALDDSSNLYVSGYFGARVIFNANTSIADTLEPVGNKNLFILKLDSQFDYLWSVRIGGTTASGALMGIEPYGFGVDPVGDIYSTGFYSGTMNFNPNAGPVHSHTANSLTEMYMLKLTKNGEYVWSQRMGGNNIINTGYDLEIDKGGDLYFTGVFRDTVNTSFDANNPNYLYSIGGNGDVFVTKYKNCIELPEVNNISISGLDSVCINSTYQYTINIPGAISYEWVLPSGINGASDSSSILVSFTDVPGNIMVRGLGNCDTTDYIYKSISLAIDPVSITVNGFELGTTGSYTTYQWLLNGSTISGATNANYTVSGNGDYQVIVTSDYGCTDTSEVYTVSNVSINERNTLAAQIKVFPNPAQDKININSPVTVNIQLTSIDGRMLLNKEQAKEVSVKVLAEGVYFLRIMDKDNRLIKVEKVVKQ